MLEMLSDRAQQVIAQANKEAASFGHVFIDTEHLLLALVKQGGWAVYFLQNLAVDLQMILLDVEKTMTKGVEIVVIGKLPYTPAAEKALQYALEEARTLGASGVSTEHLLLGLLKVKEGVACKVLSECSVTFSKVHAEISKQKVAGLNKTDNSESSPS